MFRRPVYEWHAGTKLHSVVCLNGMPVPNCIQLYVCNFLESFPLQGDLHNGKQEEAGGGSGVKDGE